MDFGKRGYFSQCKKYGINLSGMFGNEGIFHKVCHAKVLTNLPAMDFQWECPYWTLSDLQRCWQLQPWLCFNTGGNVPVESPIGPISIVLNQLQHNCDVVNFYWNRQNITKLGKSGSVRARTFSKLGRMTWNDSVFFLHVLVRTQL